MGKNVGDEINITLTANQAYGEIDELLIQTISRDQLPDDIEPEKGMMLGVGDENGSHSVAWIKEVDDEFITLDMNHPLAGKTLNFKIKIMETGCEPDPEDLHSCGCGCDQH